MTTKPIDLFFWPTPNGFKARIMLEECGLAYRVRPIDIGKGDQFKPSFLKVSPNNRIPAIVDPDGPDGRPISVFESGAILQYLGRKTGLFYPEDERARVAVDQWLFWQMGGLGPMAGQAHHFRVFAKRRVPYGIERYTTETTRLYGVLEKRLRGRSYVAGDYSIADMAIFPWVLSSEKQGQVLDDTPNVKRWVARISKRPAVERGLSKALD